MTALQLTDLTVRHPGPHGPVAAVDRVSLEIPAGTTLGLVGESGSGKSSLARAIVGLTPVHGGRVLLDGREVRARTAGDRQPSSAAWSRSSSRTRTPHWTLG